MPQRVTTKELETYELLSHALLRASRHIHLRETTFCEALQALDMRWGGRLSGGNLGWHKREGISMRMLYEHDFGR